MIVKQNIYTKSITWLSGSYTSGGVKSNSFTSQSVSPN